MNGDSRGTSFYAIEILRVASRSPEVDNRADMAEVYLFANAGKVLSALNVLGINDFRDSRVLIKLHMGEPGTKYYISPSIVKLIVQRLKAENAEPFLLDTTVAYPGPRSTVDGYRQVAHKHSIG